MRQNNICPSDETLAEYIADMLGFEELKDIEEHLALCDNCVEKTKKLVHLDEMILSLKMSSGHGGINKEYYFDTANFPAAGSEKTSGVSEVCTINGNYRIKLIPFLKSDKALLEVEALNADIKGTVVIENEHGIIFKSKIVNGKASNEIQKAIDLKNLIIRVEKD